MTAINTVMPRSQKRIGYVVTPRGIHAVDISHLMDNPDDQYNSSFSRVDRIATRRVTFTNTRHRRHLIFLLCVCLLISSQVYYASMSVGHQLEIDAFRVNVGGTVNQSFSFVDVSINYEYSSPVERNLENSDKLNLSQTVKEKVFKKAWLKFPKSRYPYGKDIASEFIAVAQKAAHPVTGLVTLAIMPDFSYLDIASNYLRMCEKALIRKVSVTECFS